MSQTIDPAVSSAADVSHDSIRTFYRQRIEGCDRQLREFAGKFVWVTRLRGVTFLSAVVLYALSWIASAPTWPFSAGAAVVFAGFVALCGYHEQLERQQGIMRQRRKISRTQLERLDRNWPAIWTPSIDIPAQHAAAVKDLDLAGEASLFQLICNAFTPMGVETLRDWLLEPASPTEIGARQSASQRLRQMHDLREELSLRGRMLATSPSGPARFVQWAEGPCWWDARPRLKWAVRILTLLGPTLVIVGLLGWAPAVYVFAALVAVVLVNIMVNVFFTGLVHEVFDTVSSRSNDIQHYRGLFALIDRLPHDDELLNRLKSKMGTTTHESLDLLKRLARIMRFANLRRSVWAIFHIVFQACFFVDFHVLCWLEHWQRKHGAKVRPWFEAIGELETLSSLATLAHDNPHWVWPKVVEDTSIAVAASSLGHPLLPEQVGRRNDVHVGPAGRFLLVTGSNMSGKSTLLRSVGVNVVLAQAGGPVCATAMSLPPLLIATSMRIQDSLEDGVSFFMAELKRLKEIVDQSSQVAAIGKRRLLFLLDEILQGTNSVERHIAVARVIDRLVTNGAFGAVSTHDLALAKSPELVDVCEIVHFRETIRGEGSREQMTFDYRLRQGLATTTNALKLLELVGLSES